MNQPLLQTKQLTKYFMNRSLFRKTPFRAVHDVTFALNPGEVLAIVGESGSGKSTLARMITNLIPASSGEIIYQGESILKNKALQKRLPSLVQMIFQDPFATLNPHHTIGYIVGRPLKIAKKSGKNVRERVMELLTSVGLTPAEEVIDKYPYQLSGGQKQRVMIAKVLGLEPKLVVADEPTSMLDVSIGIDIMNLMLDLRERHNLAYILITHNLGSARYMADHIMVMYAGEIMESGPTESVISNPRHPYTKLLLDSSPDPWRKDTEPMEVIEPTGPPPRDEGCSFRHRCPFARTECAAGPIPRKQVDQRHEVKCVL